MNVTRYLRDDAFISPLTGMRENAEIGRRRCSGVFARHRRRIFQIAIVEESVGGSLKHIETSTFLLFFLSPFESGIPVV